MRGRYAPLMGGRYCAAYAWTLMRRLCLDANAPLMGCTMPLGCVHMGACVRSLGALQSLRLSPNIERSTPQKGLMGTSQDAQVKICRGSLPRRGELNVPLVIKVKKSPRRAN